MEKYCRAGQDTGVNMVHAHCMLDTEGYKHTLTICNTYFSTTTMVTRKRLTRTLPLLFIFGNSTKICPLCPIFGTAAHSSGHVALRAPCISARIRSQWNLPFALLKLLDESTVSRCVSNLTIKQIVN